MYSQVEKPKENKGRAVVSSVAQKKSNGLQDFGFVDNRSVTVTQRKQKKSFDSFKGSANNFTAKVTQTNIIQQMKWTLDNGTWRDEEWKAGVPANLPQSHPDGRAWKNFDTWDDTSPVVKLVTIPSSDIKSTYDVKKGCALQALIQAGHKPFGKTTARDLHDHIWRTPSLAAYKDYDISYPALYAILGIKPITVSAKKIKDLPIGDYICEIAGHMVAVTVTKDKVTMKQDPGNKLGTTSDQLLTVYQ
ncbi:MAG: hypothetical protein JW915_21175 [Chitinispirillaceae bacterium]|nr:hypothetical protein [Chitinispirillaceae bacterium]